MFGMRQTIFLTPYFQFEERFDFLFVFVMNTMIFCVCLPGIMENNVHFLGKVMEFYYQISVVAACASVVYCAAMNDNAVVPISGGRSVNT